jgi:protein-tyrosine phosphatase
VRTPSAIGRSLQQLCSTNYGTARGLVRAVLADLEEALGRIARFEAYDPAATRRLVFVCQGNICRSAYADCVARTLDLNSASVGLATSSGAPAFELARRIAAERGVDMSAHVTTAWPDLEAMPGDLFLPMEIRQAHALLRLGVPGERIALLGTWARPRRVHLHDPHTLSPAYFRTCLALIDSAVRNLALELAQAGSPAVRTTDRNKSDGEGGSTRAPGVPDPTVAARVR